MADVVRAVSEERLAARLSLGAIDIVHRTKNKRHHRASVYCEICNSHRQKKVLNNKKRTKSLKHVSHTQTG